MKSGEVYSRVSRCMWVDERFQGLSRAAPSARELWLYLLTGPRCGQIPGLIHVGVLGIAEDLDWPVDETRMCLDEIVAAGMALVDVKARLIWLPKAMRHNWPANSSIVLGWAKSWRMLPECPLRDDAAAGIEEIFATTNPCLGEAFRVAIGRQTFDRAKVQVGRRRRRRRHEEHRAEHGVEHHVEHGVLDGVPHHVEHGGGGGVPHQEQEQEQEQEQDQEHIARARACEGGAQTKPREPEDLIALVAELAAKDEGNPDSFARRCEERIASGRTLSPAQRNRLQTILDDRRKRDEAQGEADPLEARALELYGKLRDRRVKGERYVWTNADAAHIKKLVAEARGISARENGSVEPDVIVERAIRAYVDDPDPKLRDERWPLAWLPSRMTRYPLLKSKKAPQAAVEQSPPPPEHRRLPPPAAMTALLGGVGTGGGGGAPGKARQGAARRPGDPIPKLRTPEEETADRWEASAAQARALGIDTGPEPKDVDEMRDRLPALQKACVIAMGEPGNRSATA